MNALPVPSVRAAAWAAVKDRHVAILCGGSDEEAAVSLAAAEKVAVVLQVAGVSHELVGPAELLATLRMKPRSVVNNILYGPTGENGAMAGMLAALGVPVTYSNACSSAIALDKWRSKLVLGSSAAHTTWSIAFDKESCDEAVREAGLRNIWPLVCKPLKLGCSIGIDLVRNPRDLAMIARTTASRFGSALLEPFLAGDEFSVAVLEPPGYPACALPILHVAYTQEALATSDIKYGKGDISLHCPAKVGPGFAEMLSNMALATYRELGCYPLARIDYRCDRQGVPYLLEVNHHPGMTPHSWFPYIASCAGIDYSTLSLIVLHAAIARAERKREKRGPLLSVNDICEDEPTHDQPGSLALSIDTETGWTARAAGNWPSLSPAQVVRTRGASKDAWLLDLMYEDAGANKWRAILEALGYRRIGPSLLCCALSADKRYQRLVADELGIAQPQWTGGLQWRASESGQPLVAKRRKSWQSRHVFLLASGNSSLEKLGKPDAEDWLVEHYVSGDEYHVGLLSSERGVSVLPVARIPGAAEPWLLDEGRKKAPALIEIQFISEDDPSVADLVTQSKRLLHAFDNPPFARVEWRRDREGPYFFLEFDHCPGLGEHSIVTRMLRSASVTLADVIRNHITRPAVPGAL